jgi:hypothetical protein
MATLELNRMTPVSLSQEVTVAEAVPAITATSFVLVDVLENYGHTETDPDNPNRVQTFGRGQSGSVNANILFNTNPVTQRHIEVWSGDEYVAVRRTWTDETLMARITELLGM